MSGADEGATPAKPPAPADEPAAADAGAAADKAADKPAGGAKADKAKKPEAPAGKWAVQVGAFKSKADAKEQLAMMAKRFAKQFAHADANVADKIDDHYRARFKGMTEASAKDACKALKAKKQVCMVVPPA